MTEKCEHCGSLLTKNTPYHCNKCKSKYAHSIKDILNYIAQDIKDRERGVSRK